MDKRSVLLVAFATIVLLCIIGVLSSSTRESTEFEIRLSFLGSPEDEDFYGALAFKKYVEAHSDGRAKVSVYPSGQFCSNERECIESLQSGVLQVFMFPTGVLGGVFEPGQVFDLPYAFRDDAVAECTFDGPVIDELRSAILAADLKIRLMVVGNTGGWRNFASTSRKIRTPSDIRGLKIRTIAAPVQQELVRQLGGNPTPIAWSEVYMALATGVVDGTKNGIQDIMGMKLDEQIKFVILDGHSYMGAMWWYSEPSWQATPEELQQVIKEGLNSLKETTRAIVKKKEKEAYDAFLQSGGEVVVPTPEEKALFSDAASGVRRWFAEQFSDEWLVKLNTAVESCEKQNPLKPLHGRIDSEQLNPVASKESFHDKSGQQ